MEKSKFSQKLHSELLFGGLVPYLESCPGVTQVHCFSRPPVTHLDLSIWEQSNSAQLPNDLKQFLLLSDGVFLFLIPCYLAAYNIMKYRVSHHRSGT